LITFDGRGSFQAQELSPPPSPDEHVDSSSERIDATDCDSRSIQAAPIDVTVSLSPAHPIVSASLRMLRMCFNQEHALKNIILHAIVLLLFAISFINTVVFIITITSQAQLFQDVSAGFVCQYLFFCVVIQAVIDAVINAALACVVPFPRCVFVTFGAGTWRFAPEKL
jgi:hypothetical protein